MSWISLYFPIDVTLSVTPHSFVTAVNLVRESHYYWVTSTNWLLFYSRKVMIFCDKSIFTIMTMVIFRSQILKEARERLETPQNRYIVPVHRSNRPTVYKMKKVKVCLVQISSVQQLAFTFIYYARKQLYYYYYMIILSFLDLCFCVFSLQQSFNLYILPQLIFLFISLSSLLCNFFFG